MRLSGLQLRSNWDKPLQLQNHLGEVTGQKRGKAHSVGALQCSGDGREDGRQLGLGVWEPGGHEATGPDLGVDQDAVHGDLKLAGRGLWCNACSEIMGGDIAWKAGLGQISARRTKAPVSAMRP